MGLFWRIGYLSPETSPASTTSGSIRAAHGVAPAAVFARPVSSKPGEIDGRPQSFFELATTVQPRDEARVSVLTRMRRGLSRVSVPPGVSG